MLRVEKKFQDVLVKPSTHLNVHFLQNCCSGFIDVSVGSAAADDDLVVGSWLNVSVPMIVEPIVAEVTGRFAAPDVFVVVHKFHMWVSTKSVCNLQFSMDPSYDFLSRSQTSTYLAIQGEVEVNNSVERILRLYYILRCRLLAYHPHNLIWTRVFLVNCNLWGL